jgi:hypothetical protein
MGPPSHFTRVLLYLYLYMSLELPLSTHTHRTPGEPSHTTSVEQSGAPVIVHLHGGMLTSAMPRTASPWPTLLTAIDQSAFTYFKPPARTVILGLKMDQVAEDKCCNGEVSILTHLVVRHIDSTIPSQYIPRCCSASHSFWVMVFYSFTIATQAR